MSKNLSKKIMSKTIGPWLAAVQKARKALGIKGFQPIKKGSAFYNKAKSFYKKKWAIICTQLSASLDATFTSTLNRT